MVFQYRRVLVSGTAEGVEGVSAGLAEISTFMQDCGWTLVEDRSAEPGTGADDTHMKYVFSSNGESGNYPTFYITLYSGSSTSVNSNSMYTVAHTAYDIGTHLTPASGVRTGTSNNVTDSNGDNLLQIMSQSDNTEIYMSGDSEMVHLVTRKESDNNSANTMDNAYFGRFNSFYSVEDNPYPMIVVCGAGNSINTAITTYPRGIAGNPPTSSPDRSRMTTHAPAAGSFDANQPYDLGVDSIFTALPILISYENLNNIKGMAGTVRNGWISADSTRLLNLSVLTSSGTEGLQEFISFTSETLSSTPSLILRKS